MEVKDYNNKTSEDDKVLLTHNLSVKVANEEVFWVKYSPDDSQLACASADGVVRILDLATLEEPRELIAHPKEKKLDQMPITWLRWRQLSNGK